MQPESHNFTNPSPYEVTYQTKCLSPCSLQLVPRFSSKPSLLSALTRYLISIVSEYAGTINNSRIASVFPDQRWACIYISHAFLTSLFLNQDGCSPRFGFGSHCQCCYINLRTDSSRQWHQLLCCSEFCVNNFCFGGHVEFGCHDWSRSDSIDRS
jgi:hypothetical protein